MAAHRCSPDSPAAFLTFRSHGDRSYIDDRDVAVLSGQLRLDGIANDLFVIGIDGRAEGSELEGQFAEIADRIATYDPLIVERLWDPQLLLRLRDAVPTKTIIALRGEHVLSDARGADFFCDDPRASLADLIVWLRGEAAMPPEGTSVAARDADGQLRWEIVADGIAPERRAYAFAANLHPIAIGADLSNRSFALAGNAGCPYQADARRNPVYAGVDIPEQYGRGCAFCTTGNAYEGKAPADVCESVLEQIRFVRTDAPEIGRFVLKDQNPFGYLVELVEACAREGIGGFKLLLETRAEWFLRNQRRFETALEVAATAGIRLAPYLVGIENFSQIELDRLNKGISVETNLEFLALLNRWQSEKGQALDLSDAAFGFMLFTPWTTLDDLRRNHEAIQRTGFERLRGGILHSRARLYPDTALYYLAQRDGLLVESYASTADDAARRYGYFAAHPWRFQDPRVERLAPIAGELSERLGQRDSVALLDACLHSFERAGDDWSRLTSDAVWNEYATRTSRVSGRENRELFAAAGRVELATQRCDLSCAWCRHCTGQELPQERVAATWANTPGDKAPVLRIAGGDPFRYGDFAGWMTWARSRPDLKVAIEGPAASLAGPDRTDILDRILAQRPDGVSIVLPTVDVDRTLALTGRRWEPLTALDSAGLLAEANVAVEVVIPVNPDTVESIERIVGAVRNSRAAAAVVTLRRAPRRTSSGSDEAGWSELVALEAQLASIDDGAVRFDAGAGYAPCLFREPMRRAGWFPMRSNTSSRPLGSLCTECAWVDRCTFRFSGAPPASEQVHPLSRAEANRLVPGRRSQIGETPQRFHTPRRPLGLPELLCFAPWTSLSVTDPRRNPVPCALSWVDTVLRPEETARESGASVEVETARAEHARGAFKETEASWYCVDNDELALSDLWNSPLLRRMRREMRAGGKSSRCRSMCRVVMGVEERGIAYFERSADELTPAIVANRDLLREEITRGQEILTAKPMELLFGVSANCNISCGFCDGPLGAYGDLSDRRRDEILELLPTLISFGVSGPGEPLMNGNYRTLLNHISDVGYPGLSVSLTTNGTLLTPEFLARNANVPWGSIRISLNAGSAETYQRMTGKDYFGRILANLEALCRLRDRAARRFQVTLSLVTGSVQMGDLAKFAEIVDQFGTELVVEPMYDDMRGLSPWIRRERLERLRTELSGVADAFVRRNPDIARAFRAVADFASRRLASDDLDIMKGH